MPDQFTEESLNHLKEQDTRPEFLPCTDDVTAYLEFIRNLSDYRRFVDQRIKVGDEQLEELLKAERITAQEYAEWKDQRPYGQKYEDHARMLEETELFKGFFWNIYEDVAHLKYNSERYSEKFNRAYHAYKVGVCLEMETARGNEEAPMSERRVDRGLYAVSLDRSRLHDEAAKSLLEELPVLQGNERLGRVIVRAFLVDERFDFIPSARQADLARALRAAPDISKASILAGWDKGPARYSVETALALQEKFAETVPQNLSECKKADYGKVDYSLISSYTPKSGD